MCGSIKHFSVDESGAITVDWTVLTGGVVGLGLATMGVVSSGVEDLSRDTANQLSSDGWNMFGNGAQTLASFDFTGGNAAGWLGGQVMDMGGSIGEALVLGAGDATAYLVDIPAGGVDEAIMQFDLIAGDSIDSSDQWGYDSATISLNGQTVAIAEAQGNSMTFDIPQSDGTTVQATVTVEEEHLGGNPGWTDSAAAVTVTVDQPSEPIEFEVHSNSNQGINDEFWALDNFDASTTGGPGF